MKSLSPGQAPELIWGVPTRGKWAASGGAGTDPNQAQTIHGVCSSCAHPVWEPRWVQPRRGRWQRPLSAHLAIFVTPPRKQLNRGRSWSTLSYPDLSNGIIAETKVSHSLALTNQFKLTFSECVSQTLPAQQGFKGQGTRHSVLAMQCWDFLAWPYLTWMIL